MYDYKRDILTQFEHSIYILQEIISRLHRLTKKKFTMEFGRFAVSMIMVSCLVSCVVSDGYGRGSKFGQYNGVYSSSMYAPMSAAAPIYAAVPNYGYSSVSYGSVAGAGFGGDSIIYVLVMIVVIVALFGFLDIDLGL